jgi:hypothetical protein
VEVIEHVVGQRLGDIASVKLEGEKHQTGPGAYSLVDLCLD